MAFITAAILAERPAVHLIVDDDNTAAIALYRSLGFYTTGRCYIAYLSGPAGHPGPGVGPVSRPTACTPTGWRDRPFWSGRA
jgi:hypothetical protein